MRSRFAKDLDPEWAGSDEADPDGDKPEALPVGIPGDEIGLPVLSDADELSGGGGVDDEVSSDEFDPPSPVTPPLLSDGGIGDDPDWMTVRATWRPAKKREKAILKTNFEHQQKLLVFKFPII